MDSRPKLKDLAFLKDQLEHLQRRVENEVQAGVGKVHPNGCFTCLFVLLLQEGSFLTSPFFKGFLAGYVVAKLRSSAVLGFFVGACTGVYAAQTYAVPNVEKTIKDCFSSLRKGPD
ncbi:hypothetical protein lerEdw1_015019 [Lerista edwardsae]|nr:hypothetical protein lerEdw1_015019 [Lerista edwardsae]